MDIQKYELTEHNGDYTLVIYIEPETMEFSTELGDIPKQKNELQTQIFELMKEKFPHVPIRMAKVVVGSLLLTTLYFGATASIASAQTNTTQAVTSTQVDMYTVKAGDTLYTISKRFNVSTVSLKTVNQLTSDTIYIGQQLKLPYFTYTVTAGDTLYSIAKRYNTTVTQIRSINQFSSDILKIGQTLRIPQTGALTEIIKPTDTQPVPAPELSNQSINATYTVLPGDTLYSIAQKNETTVATIKSLNNLQTDSIFIGQILAISGLNLDTIAPSAPTFINPALINNQSVLAYPVKGEAEPGSAIQITFSDGIHAPMTKNVTVDTNGGFNTNVDLSKLNDGKITITATATDAAKNISKLTSTTVVKDTQTAEPVLNNNQMITNQNANNYTFFGLADPGSTIKLTISDGVNPEITTEAITNEAGEFRTNMDIRTLNDGQLTITAQATDQVGNRSTATKALIQKETMLAPPVIRNPEMINSQTATTYSISGKAQPGTAVDITVSDGINPDVIASTITNENGEFHASVDVSTLLDTSLTISAFQTSNAGITSNSSYTTIEKDTTSPTVPIMHNNNVIYSKNQLAYNLVGTAEKNAELRIRIFNTSGQSKVITGVVDDNGVFNLPVDLSMFNEGDVTFELTQVDQAGNISQVTTKTLIKDTVGPTMFNLDQLTSIYNGNVNNYQIRGKAEPHTTIDIVISDGTNMIKESVEADEEGWFELQSDLSGLKDGTITYSFTGTDSAGNTSKLAPTATIKDTTAPAEAVITLPPFVNLLNQNNYVVNGASVEEGAAVIMVVSDGITKVTKMTRVVNGTFTTTLDLSGLVDGPLTFEVTQTDRAGNTSIVQASTIEKDTIVENTIASKNGFRYENLQYIYTVMGTAEENAKIEVELLNKDGSTIVTRLANVDESGFYSIDIYVDNIDNVSSATVTQTDRAGNQSELTSVQLNQYSIAKGDTLYSIAKRYNTTADALMSMNHLSNDLIQPGQVLRMPITASEVINLGYMYFGNTKEYINTVSSTGHTVNIVSPTYFDINPDGTLKLTYQVDQNFINTMHHQGIRVVPFLSNHWDRDIGRALLQNKELAARQIADAVARYDLDGVNVDIENVTDADRSNYTEFVRLLRSLIPATKEVSAAVAANPNGWDTGWHGSYDYTNLAKYADYLMIMTYDESYTGGPAGPVASASWVEKSIQYAINQNVPRDKIVIGIAQYGRYWISGQSYGGFGISNIQVESMIDKYNGVVEFDPISKSPKATITIKAGDPVTVVSGTTLGPGTYTIWYENEESIRHKLELVSKYNIRGVGNWSLGQETSNVWNSYATTLPTQVSVSSKTVSGTNVNTVDSVDNLNNTATQQFKTYTVVSGDSLWAIATRNNTTVNAIKEVNGLISDSVNIGQVLKIPVTVKTYTVVAGDTLYGIATRNHTTVSTIKTANNLTTDVLTIGQLLKIPL
ncbi:LysM peptidoglycan-binding domain-containing protein [Ferdinandcohnia quinoae]|uniref:LysM peptidoglycan-binding domain-containing protein n=1 Tax=Fredinandcohnia quinoae TaxID=2918902 RepID=A0AAW5DX26_9BACI|nr:LysM peptidoglycan-binding domain-containing protein [Fredinandcohnia sp. SECRCQ15]MCH1625200.1 LysM peptidoglycan-binding domain-containing protein [Fredinandcohnia sp. SECRCQ15]